MAYFGGATKFMGATVKSISYAIGLSAISLLIAGLDSSSALAGPLWQNTFTGMSVDQLKAQYPQAVDRGAMNGNEEVRISNIIIGKVTFEAICEFEGLGLHKVTLLVNNSPIFHPDNYASIFSDTPPIVIAASIAEQLRNKYGPPVNVHNSSVAIIDNTENFLSGKTTIELEYLDDTPLMGSKGFQTISITYDEKTGAADPL